MKTELIGLLKKDSAKRHIGFFAHDHDLTLFVVKTETDDNPLLRWRAKFSDVNIAGAGSDPTAHCGYGCCIENAIRDYVKKISKQELRAMKRGPLKEPIEIVTIAAPELYF